MRYLLMAALVASTATVATAALLPACAALPAIDANLCGNGVLDLREECEPAAPNGKASCAQPGTPNQCRFVCSRTQSCPAGYGCGSDDVCRKPTGTFANAPRNFRGELSTLALGDFDGDGRQDVVAQGKTSLRVNYMDAQGALARTLSVPISRGRFTTTSLTADNLATITLLDAEIAGTGGASGGGLSTFRGRPDRTIAPTIYPFVPLNASDVLPIPARFNTLGRLGVGQEFASISDLSAYGRTRGKSYALTFYDAREDGSNDNIPLFPLPELARYLKPNPVPNAPPIGTGLSQVELPATGRFITLNENGTPHTCDTIVLTIKDPSTVAVLPLCLRKTVPDWRDTSKSLAANTPNFFPYKLNAADPDANPEPTSPPQERIDLSTPPGTKVSGAANFVAISPLGIAPAFSQAMAGLAANPGLAPFVPTIATALQTSAAASFAVPLFSPVGEPVESQPDVLVPAEIANAEAGKPSEGVALVGFGDGTGHTKPRIAGDFDDALRAYPGISTKDTGGGRVLAVGDLNGDRVLDWVDSTGIHFNTAAYDRAIAVLKTELAPAGAATVAAVVTPVATARGLLATRAGVAAPGDSRWQGARILDIDGDGALDVIAYSANEIDVYRGTLPAQNPNNVVYPTFTQQNYPIDGSIVRLTVGDSDADGYQDISVATRNDSSGVASDAIYVLFGTRTLPEPPRFFGRVSGLSSLSFIQISWLLSGRPDRYLGIAATGTTPSGVVFGVALQGDSERTLRSRFGLSSPKNPNIRDVGLNSVVGRFFEKDKPAVVAIGFGTEREQTNRSAQGVAARLWAVGASGDAEFDLFGLRSSAPFTEKDDKEIPIDAPTRASRVGALQSQLLNSALVAVDLDKDGIDEAVTFMPNVTDAAGAVVSGRMIVSKASEFDSSLPSAGKVLPAQAFAFGKGTRLSAFAADLNGDGNQDVVVSYIDATTGAVAKVFLNDGSGKLLATAGIDFVAGGSVAGGSATPRAFAATASGELAVLLDSGVRFYRSAGTALVASERAELKVAIKDPQAIAFGDINGDGVEDLVIGLAASFDLYLGNAVIQ